MQLLLKAHPDGLVAANWLFHGGDSEWRICEAKDDGTDLKSLIPDADAPTLMLESVVARLQLRILQRLE